jgi:hypothetical protein
MDLFTTLGRRQDREQLQALTIAVRHSQGTDAKIFREFLNSLGED